MGAARLRLRARRLARLRALAGLRRPFLAARDARLLRLHRVGRRAALVQRQGRPERRLLLRHQPVAGRLAAAAASRRDVHLGRRGRLVPRHDAPRRHPLAPSGPTGTTCRSRPCSTASASAARAAARPATLVCGDETLSRRRARAQPLRASATTSSPIRSTTTITARARRIGTSVTVPFLSAANWGGQGLHPRGNFEGFVRAASKDKWLEAHGLEHWTHFYTDYGRDLQKRFFDHFLKGEDNGWDGQPRVRCRCATSTASSERARERMAARAHALDEVPPRRRDRRRSVERRRRRAARLASTRLGDGLSSSSAAARRATEITGPLARAAAVSSSTAGRRPVPRAARLLAGPARGHLHGRDRSAYADRAGLAARLAPQARPAR